MFSWYGRRSFCFFCSTCCTNKWNKTNHQVFIEHQFYVGAASNADENMKFIIVPDLTELIFWGTERMEYHDPYFDTVISLLNFNLLFEFSLSLVLKQAQLGPCSRGLVPSRASPFFDLQLINRTSPYGLTSENPFFRFPVLGNHPEIYD